MAIQGRTQLKSWFETGDKPTEQQFADWIDSYFHKTEDLATIRQIVEDAVANQDPNRFGLPDYDNTATYNPSDRVVYQERIWEATATVSGIPPTGSPNSSSNWTEISANESVIDDWQAQLYSDGDLVLYNGQIWRNTSGQASYDSTNIGNEISAGDWSIVAVPVVKNSGSILTQRAALNAKGALEATDNAPDTELDVQSGGIDTARLADDAVTTPKVLDTNITTPKLADNSVTFPKMQDIGTNRVIGRTSTPDPGDPEELTLIQEWVAVPASSSDTGITGQKAQDGTDIFMCYTSNSWLRIKGDGSGIDFTF